MEAAALALAVIDSMTLEYFAASARSRGECPFRWLADSTSSSAMDSWMRWSIDGSRSIPPARLPASRLSRKSSSSVPASVGRAPESFPRLSLSPFSAALREKPEETLAWVQSLPAGPERDRYLELAARASTRARGQI